MSYVSQEAERFLGPLGQCCSEVLLVYSWFLLYHRRLLVSMFVLSFTFSKDPKDYDCTCDFSGYGLDKYTTDDDWFYDDTTNV